MENQEIKTKRCPKCGRVLPTTEFYAKASSSDGLQTCCKECQKEQQRKRTVFRLHPKGCNPDLAGFTPRQLIEELRARGYTGEIQYVQKIKL